MNTTITPPLHLWDVSRKDMGLQLREPWRTLVLSPMGNGPTSDPNIPGGIDAGNHVAVKGYT